MPAKRLTTDRSLQFPPEFIATPTPDVELEYVTRAINVAVSGYVRVTTYGGSVETLYIAAGLPFPIQATMIHSTGTDAAGIKVLW